MSFNKIIIYCKGFFPVLFFILLLLKSSGGMVFALKYTMGINSEYAICKLCLFVIVVLCDKFDTIYGINLY